MHRKITNLSEFRFDTLRKYMHPIYARLNLDMGECRESKAEILRELVPKFYKRLRTFRNVSLEFLSERSGFTTERLKAFEENFLETTSPQEAKEIERAYCKVCYGDHEYGYFAQQIHEFFNPTIKDTKIEVARAALKQKGLLFPDIDYKTLFAPRGKVLELLK